MINIKKTDNYFQIIKLNDNEDKPYKIYGEKYQYFIYDNYLFVLNENRNNINTHICKIVYNDIYKLDNDYILSNINKIFDKYYEMYNKYHKLKNNINIDIICNNSILNLANEFSKIFHKDNILTKIYCIDNLDEYKIDTSRFVFMIIPQHYYGNSMNQLEFIVKNCKCYFYFMEQLKSRKDSNKYYQYMELTKELIKNSEISFDYNKDNFKYLENIIYLPPPVIINNNQCDKIYDILFIGLVNDLTRRKPILENLKRFFKIKIVYDKTGDELTEIINQSKVVLNLHYYDNDTLLEEVRLNEIINSDTHILSELPHIDVDAMKDKYEYEDRVTFINIIEKPNKIIKKSDPIVYELKTLLKKPNKKYEHNFNNDLTEKILIENIKNIIIGQNIDLINILIRTTYRPGYFKKCINSILSQSYTNYKIICCYDDKRCLNYLKEYEGIIEYFYVNEENNNSHKYNLYCNVLMDKVEDGWIMFLDDDDKLSNNNTLQSIKYQLNNFNQILFWQVNIAGNIIIPEDVEKIEKYKISGIGFCFHSNFKNLSKWKPYGCSDFYFINELLLNYNFNRIKLNKTLTETQHNNLTGSHGEQNEYPFEEYIEHNNIKQIYISKSLEHLKDIILKTFNLREYNNINESSVFFGVHDQNDIKNINNHNGIKYIIFENNDVDNYKYINNDNYLATSKYIKNKLLQVGKFSRLIEFDIIKLFNINNINNYNYYLYYLQKKNFLNNTNNNYKEEYNQYYSKKIICIMCSYKREKLLDYVLNYLSNINEFFKIIIVGSDLKEKKIVDKYKICEFHMFNNFPVNEKWNKGVVESRKYNPDGILILGSDDIVTKEYVRYCKYLLSENYNIIGVRSWFTLLKDNDMISDIAFMGYTDKRLNNETLGAGRVISNQILNLLDWNLYKFNIPRNKGLDGESYKKILDICNKNNKTIKHKIINITNEIYVLSIKDTRYEEISITHGSNIKNTKGSSWYLWQERCKNYEYLNYTDYYLQNKYNINHLNFLNIQMV